MPRPRLSLILLAAAAGLLALVAVVLFGVVRLSWFERQAEQRLSAALGWPVELGGLAIAYYPTPRIEVERLVLPATAQPDAVPLLEVARVAVTVPWRTVAGMGGHLTRVELDEPRLHLALDAEGRGNWDALLEHIMTAAGEGPTAFSIGELQVTDGSVRYAGTGGDDWRLAGVRLTARDVRPGVPFKMELRLGGEGAGHTFHLSLAGRAMLDPDREVYAADELTLGGWVGGGELPLAGVEWDGTVEALHADLAAGRTALRGLQARSMGVELAGQVELATVNDVTELKFDLQTRPFSPRAVGVALDQPLPETTDPAALTRATLDVAGHLNAAGLTLSRLEGQLDDSRFSGDATLPAGDAPPRLRLVLDRLDLDRYLPPASAAEDSNGSLQAAVESLSESLQELDLQADIEVGEARAAGVLARGLTVRLEPIEPGPSP